MNTDKFNINDINIEETPLDSTADNEVDFSEVEVEEQNFSDAEIDNIHIEIPDVYEEDFEESLEKISIHDSSSEESLDEIFDKDFEVIYEGELPPLENDFGNDAYKDVLASLSELDPTDGITVDYLAENRTRTFRFSEDTSLLKEYKKKSSSAQKGRKVPRLLRVLFGKGHVS